MSKRQRDFDSKQPISKRRRQAPRPFDMVAARQNARDRKMLLAAARSQQGELKGVDTMLTLSPIINTTTTNASSFVLNLIAPGTGSFNRIGRIVKLESLRLRILARYSYAAAATTGIILASTLRCVTVWDKQPGGVIPTFDTIFGHTLQDGTEATEYLDTLKYDNTGRFKILRDIVVPTNTRGQNTEGGSTDSVNVQFLVEDFLSLKGKDTIFSGQSSPCTIADISSGGLYIYFRAENNSSTSLTGIDSESYARLRYRG